MYNDARIESEKQEKHARKVLPVQSISDIDATGTKIISYFKNLNSTNYLEKQERLSQFGTQKQKQW
jgi:hypothetical protein|tara:strand:+ start:248 stop:445 length:198 start_codon:yes stop_codon:yes gene_type:complete